MVLKSDVTAGEIHLDLWRGYEMLEKLSGKPYQFLSNQKTPLLQAYYCESG